MLDTFKLQIRGRCWNTEVYGAQESSIQTAHAQFMYEIFLT